MPRALRIEFPGALYHVMNRGDRREVIFHDAHDHRSFLATLGETCAKTGWHVHAYCLMPDHFHLVLETPNANLVAGMKWLLGTYTTRFNHRHKLFGHLFSGRYKAPVVDGRGAGYFRTVCDYVHLHPARAALLRPDQRLHEFLWSSWPAYRIPPLRPPWVCVDRLLGEHGSAGDNDAGRAELEQRLERRRAHEDGDEFAAVGRGWCFGSEEFRRELLDRARTRATENHHAETRRETGEEQARRLVAAELARLGWTAETLPQQAKGHPQKISIAQRLRAETTVTLKWIAAELHMGTWTHVANRLQHAKKQAAPEQQDEFKLV